MYNGLEKDNMKTAGVSNAKFFWNTTSSKVSKEDGVSDPSRLACEATSVTGRVGDAILLARFPKK